MVVHRNIAKICLVHHHFVVYLNCSGEKLLKKAKQIIIIVLNKEI